MFTLFIYELTCLYPIVSVQFVRKREPASACLSWIITVGRDRVYLILSVNHLAPQAIRDLISVFIVTFGRNLRCIYCCLDPASSCPEAGEG